MGGTQETHWNPKPGELIESTENWEAIAHDTEELTRLVRRLNINMFCKDKRGY